MRTNWESPFFPLRSALDFTVITFGAIILTSRETAMTSS